MSSIDIISKMLAGIAFFLLAMNFMESALKHLAGRGFKLLAFFKKTNNQQTQGYWWRGHCEWVITKQFHS
jgi:hypothetical protein